MLFPDCTARVGLSVDVDGIVRRGAKCPARRVRRAWAVTILRDYHAENVMLIGGREGVAHWALLDFQDARAASKPTTSLRSSKTTAVMFPNPSSAT